MGKSVGKSLVCWSLVLLPLMMVQTAQAFRILKPLIRASRPLPSSAFESTTVPQDLVLLNSGVASFEKRLQMIESAKKSIEVEFYIYKMDLAGRIFTEALVRKAREGVKVRIIVDSAPFVREMNQFYATALKGFGIDVRFYNENVILDLQKVHQRSHRKLLVVDSEQAITGGRNIGDEYFDMSDKYNFIDRDIYVRGSLVKAIEQSFDAFWEVDMSRVSEPLLKPEAKDYGFANEFEAKFTHQGSELDRQAYRRYRQDLLAFVQGMDKAQRFINLSKEDLTAREEIRQLGREQLITSPSGVCPQTYFIADLPGEKKGARVLYDQLASFVREAHYSVLLQTPYFIMTSKENIFSEALARDVKVSLMTNSLSASDHVTTTAAFNARIPELLQQGAQVWVYDGSVPANVKMKISQKARWGIHAKSSVIDDDTIVVSTFNIDPRSKDLNSEMALICRGNKELAEALRADMQSLNDHLVELGTDGAPKDGRGRYFNTPAGRQFLYHLVSPLAQIFDFWL